MFALGHYGMALLLYAVAGYAMLKRGYVRDALFGGAIVLTYTRLPDLDTELDFLVHRGVTHTAWFAAAAGLVCLLVVVNDLWGRPRREAMRAGAWAFFLGSFSIVAHLLADVMTPWGVMPLYPLTPALYTLDLVYAGNDFANYALLVAGTLAAGVAWMAGRPGRPRRSLPVRVYRRLRGRKRVVE